MPEFPTVHTLFADTTATPFSMLPFFPALGLATTLHCVPFQCSINVLLISLFLTMMYPTAHTSLDETAATPLRRLLLPAVGLVIRLQRVPSQCSVSVRSTPLAS